MTTDHTDDEPEWLAWYRAGRAAGYDQADTERDTVRLICERIRRQADQLLLGGAEASDPYDALPQLRATSAQQETRPHNNINQNQPPPHHPRSPTTPTICYLTPQQHNNLIPTTDQHLQNTPMHHDPMGAARLRRGSQTAAETVAEREGDGTPC